MDRRSFLAGAGIGLAGLVIAPQPALALVRRDAIPHLDKARAALDRFGKNITDKNVLAIADFGQHSASARFYLVDLAAGRAETFLVAHGRGSDPAHSGWLKSYSNEPGSNATSRGAYLTSAAYVGKHGRSRRLVGLEPFNDKAEQRAIVIHGAGYVGQSILRQQGKLGRSQGCFAFAADDLPTIMDRLGPGRLLYADG